MKLMNESDFEATVNIGDKTVVDFEGSKVYSRFDEDQETVYLYIVDKESQNPVKITIKKRKQDENPKT